MVIKFKTGYNQILNLRKSNGEIDIVKFWTSDNQILKWRLPNFELELLNFIARFHLISNAAMFFLQMIKDGMVYLVIYHDHPLVTILLQTK